MPSRPASTPRVVPQLPCGKEREETSLDSPQAPGQQAFPWPDAQEIADLSVEGYEVARAAERARADGRKGVLWALGKAQDYEGHLADQFNQRNGRGLRLETIVALLRHPKSGPPLLRFFCKVARFTVGDPIRHVDEKKINRKLLEAIWRFPKEVRDPMLRRVSDETGEPFEALLPPEGWAS